MPLWILCYLEKKMCIDVNATSFHDQIFICLNLAHLAQSFSAPGHCPMPLPIHPTHTQQPFTGGLGASFISLIKHCNKFKSTAIVELIGCGLKVNHLKKRLTHLKHHREHKKMPQESPIDPLEDAGDQEMPDEEDIFMSELPRPVNDKVKPSWQIEPN